MTLADVRIIGTGITPFGMFVDVPLRDLAGAAARRALADADIDGADVDMVFFGNAAAGLLTGQEMIRAQTSLSTSPLAGRPMMSVENACASSSSAFHLACMAVASGMHDIVAVVGAEKMTSQDRRRAGDALATAVDVERPPANLAPPDTDAPGATPRPVFMELYAQEARQYMERSGATAEDLARIVAKSSANGALNPIAQTRTALSVAEVLQARTIVDPLTRPMCSSIGDGAAALIVCSATTAERLGRSAVKVAASVVWSGHPEREDLVRSTAARAYADAGLGPAEIDLFEVHDAAAPAELVIMEEIGLAPVAGAPALLRAGATQIGGASPVNPSGGLLSRGHPIGATGVAQLVELCDQLRGRAGARQIDGARIGLAENAGGSLGHSPAACAVTILSS